MKSLIDPALHLWSGLTTRLDAAGRWLAPLGLRLILAYEFWQAGITKLRGNNWFGRIQEKFPFPFNQLSAEWNWLLATWGELVFAVLLVLGLFTRFAAFSLLVITVVATAAVHWPAEWSSLAQLWQGYQITNRDDAGNFKLPLVFALMLMVLILSGPGRLSLDALMRRVTLGLNPGPGADPCAFAIALVVIGLPLVFLMPLLGATLLLMAVLLGVAGRWLRG